MSATNRGGERRKSDFYETPPWCAKLAVKNIPLPGGHWLEPGAGSGNLIRAVDEARNDVLWTAIELDERHRHSLLKTDAGVIISDFRSITSPLEPYSVAFGNPPYSLAAQFIEHALSMAKHVCFLLRLSFLECKKRRSFFNKFGTPDVYVLEQRPSFTGNGTDACAYAWMHWAKYGDTIECNESHVRILQGKG